MGSSQSLQQETLWPTEHPSRLLTRKWVQPLNQLPSPIYPQRNGVQCKTPIDWNIKRSTKRSNLSVFHDSTDFLGSHLRSTNLGHMYIYSIFFWAVSKTPSASWACGSWSSSVQIAPFKNKKSLTVIVNYIFRWHNTICSMLDPKYGVGKICLTAKRKASRHHIIEIFNLI